MPTALDDGAAEVLAGAVVESVLGAGLDDVVGGVEVVARFDGLAGFVAETVGPGVARSLVRVVSGIGSGSAAPVGERVGFGDWLACGHRVPNAMSGGSCRPPSCHTQASVAPGSGSWLPAPWVA